MTATEVCSSVRRMERKGLPVNRLASLAKLAQAAPARPDQHHQPGRSAEEKLQKEAVRSRVKISNKLQHLTTTKLKAKANFDRRQRGSTNVRIEMIG